MTLLTPQSGSTSINLNGELINQTELREDSMYLVDFSKLNSVTDLITIFAAMGVSFHKSHPHIDLVKPFLATDNPIPFQQPEKKK
jgi:alpha-glucuronidase